MMLSVIDILRIPEIGGHEGLGQAKQIITTPLYSVDVTDDWYSKSMMQSQNLWKTVQSLKKGPGQTGLHCRPLIWPCALSPEQSSFWGNTFTTLRWRSACAVIDRFVEIHVGRRVTILHTLQVNFESSHIGLIARRLASKDLDGSVSHNVFLIFGEISLNTQTGPCFDDDNPCINEPDL